MNHECQCAQQWYTAGRCIQYMYRVIDTCENVNVWMYVKTVQYYCITYHLSHEYAWHCFQLQTPHKCWYVLYYYYVHYFSFSYGARFYFYPAGYLPSFHTHQPPTRYSYFSNQNHHRNLVCRPPFTDCSDLNFENTWNNLYSCPIPVALLGPRWFHRWPTLIATI